MSHYVEIKHPIRGDCIYAVPTGKVRQRKSEVSEIEAEVAVITPKSRISKIWIKKSDIITP
jgi:hypothetical protein